MNSTVDAADDESYEFYNALKAVHIYYLPVIIVIGVLGNLLSICVLFHAPLKNLSSSYYLASLAASDSGFLLSLAITWLDSVSVTWLRTPIVCPLTMYAQYLFSFLSPWFVVNFTVERFIAIGYPLLRPSWCTTGRARLCIAVLTVSASIFYIWVLVMFKALPTDEDGRLDCTQSPTYNAELAALNHTDTFITLLLPSLIIIVGNILISRKLYQLYMRNKEMQEGQSIGAADENVLCSPDTARSRVELLPVNGNGEVKENTGASKADNERDLSPEITSDKSELRKCRSQSKSSHEGSRWTSKRNNSMRSRSQMNITKTLVIISTIFVLLNLPAHVMRMTMWVMVFREEMPSLHMRHLQHLFNLLFYTNFSINFFLYMLSGANFRAALRNMLFSRRHRPTT